MSETKLTNFEEPDSKPRIKPAISERSERKLLSSEEPDLKQKPAVYEQSESKLISFVDPDSRPDFDFKRSSYLKNFEWALEQ